MCILEEKQLLSTQNPTPFDPRTVLLDAADQGKGNAKEMLEAILALEQQQQRGNLAQLEGTWQLLWTSGTQQYQKFLQDQWPTPSLQPISRGNIVQQIDVPHSLLKTQISFGIGTLSVSGPFQYSDRHRVEFTFQQVQLTVKALPKLKLPMGSWAKGWLQTTYLDDLLHIERGDRGGISVYLRSNSEQQN